MLPLQFLRDYTKSALNPASPATLFMPKFEDYFSDFAIIKRLCIARIKHADTRHKQLFYRQISADFRISENQEQIDFLPPRRHWKRFRNKRRDNTAEQNQNLVALTRATMKLRSEHPQPQWAVRLSERINRIRSRALSDKKFRFTPPTIAPIEKEKGSNEYRAIARFELDDQIIEGLTAKYIRELFDPFFSSSSLAFRCARGCTPPPTHHDAVTKIQNYRRRYSTTGLYAAECDIRGFYDCVSHRTAWDCLQKLINEARSKKTEFKIHPQALQIFRAYLYSYSFTRSVKKQSAALLEGKEKQGATFPWPEKKLRKFHTHPEAEAIGIPQGGALSCFIANCVLHQADVRVELIRKKKGTPFRYLRYCDDMILLATDEKVCRKVFASYQDALKELKLPIHAPKRVRTYGKKIWSKKSRKPFLWGRPTIRSTVPWVQFVGYQMRHDGLIRVKTKSIAKHKAKILTETERLLTIIKKATAQVSGMPPVACLRKSPKQIVHRFRQKLISVAVGRRAVHHDLRTSMPKCWAGGFKMVHGKKTPLNALKELDRFRERQIARVVRKLKNAPSVNTTGSPSRVRSPRYYGFPFSYVGQFLAGRKSKL